MQKRIQGFIVGFLCCFFLTAVVFAEPIMETVSVFFDDYRIVINGKDKSNMPDDMKSLNYNGRVYVPLRYVGEALNMDVNWVESEKTILLDSKMDKKYVLEPTEKISDAELTKSLSVIRKRLISSGINSVQTNLENGKIVVSGLSSELNKEILESCLIKGELNMTDCDGQIILDHNHITAAFPCYDDLTKNGILQNYIEICLTDEGQKILASETERISMLPDGKNFISICVDQTLYSSPFVQYQIDAPAIIISGYFTKESASSLAAVLSSEPLPVAFKISE